MFSRQYATSCRRRQNEVELRTQPPQYDTAARESVELLRQEGNYQHLLRDDSTVYAEVSSHHEYGYVDYQPSTASITYDIGHLHLIQHHHHLYLTHHHHHFIQSRNLAQHNHLLI